MQRDAAPAGAARAVTAEQGRRIVDDNRYLTLATADDDGTPWATPVWFAHVGYTTLVWASKPGARHSRNVATRPEVGIVVYDSSVRPGEAQAVYFEARAGEVAPEDLDRLVAAYADRSVAQGLPPWSSADVVGEARHRLYAAGVTAASILGDGDQRIPVDL